MSRIWTKAGSYERIEFEKEKDLEAAILEIQDLLFGPDRIYLDIKRKIGGRGSIHNIPDGYLIDLSGHKPRLYVVEVELSRHEPLRHIAVQILEFSLSFADDPKKIKAILLDALNDYSRGKTLCQIYSNCHEYRNLDHFLEYLVHDVPFSALVIIDEASLTLENVLASKFSFPVEVLEVAAFRNKEGNTAYFFEPFLEGVLNDNPIERPPTLIEKRVDLTQIDTVVVPAWEKGFKEVFLGENRWHAIRIHASMRPQIKYIAGYQVAPISAITHIAPVKSVEPWKDTGKVVVNFSEPAHEIGPIRLEKGGRVKQLQGIRYATKSLLDSAKTLDDVW